ETGYLKEVLYYSELDRIAQMSGIELSMERGIIYNFDLNGKVKLAYVFSTFQGSKNLIDKDNVSVLPQGKYLTLAYNKDNESERVQELIKFVSQRNMKVKCFLEIELFNDLFNTETYSCQIQMCVDEENSYMDEIES
ncbi:MAG: MerR family transcriptional regulator, partial [Clostridium sp.]